MSTNQQLIEWSQAVMQNLADIDRASAEYIRDHRVSLHFRKQGAHASAFWMPGRRIFLNTRYFSLETNPGDPRVRSILIHELRHLQQGMLTALSIYGELDAWQLGFRIYHDLTGLPYEQNLVEFMSLPVCWDRQVLRHARELMQAYAGKAYRADLLPLYPINLEIKYRLGLRIDNVVGD